jgi:uncharacterized protein (TIGR01777 family)
MGSVRKVEVDKSAASAVYSVKTEMTEYTNKSIAKSEPLRIVLPGGTGHLGGILARHFTSSGHRVTVLSRTPSAAAWRVVKWDGENIGNWTEELDGADVVINLAGRSVDCRYSAAHRREIMDSRTKSTRVLGEAIRQLANPPGLWMNASTATIYRHSADRAMNETGELGGNERGVPSTWRFSIEVAKAWEASFFDAETPGTRRIALRSAMVMSTGRGGPFETLLRLVQLGLGGSAGVGTQFMSWVHERDFLRVLEFLIQNEDIEGVVNVAAPNPLPNAEFMRALRVVWGRSFGLSAQRWMLELGAIFLRTETELILKSRRVVPGRLLDHGFQFDFPEWDAAARNLMQRMRDENACCVPQEIGRSVREN